MAQSVLVVAHSHFPRDPRIRKQVESLVAAGRRVEVICLRGAGERRVEETEGLRVVRLPVRRHRGSGLAAYLLEYAAFFLLASVLVPWRWLRHRHAVIQTHTLPDPLVFVALIPRLLGARVVLDMHELMPELFQSRYGLSDHSLPLRLLRSIERASCAFAHHVITVSEPVADRLVQRGVPRDRITIVMNTPAMADRALAPGSRPAGRADDNGLVLAYAGLVSDLYDLGLVLRALALLAERGVDDIRLMVVGEGPALAGVEREASALGLRDRVRFEGWVPAERVPGLLAEADVAVVPLTPVPYMEFALPTKVFEGLAAGLPVLTTRLRTVLHYLDADTVCYAAAGDAEDLAARIDELRSDPEKRRRYAERGLSAVRALSWERQEERYLDVMGER